MRTHPLRVAWIVSVALLAGGGLLLALFPQPFITYYCSTSVCPSQVSGGFSIGYVVIALGLGAAVVAAIISVVSLASRSATGETGQGTPLVAWLPPQGSRPSSIAQPR
jgi:hypothetical protein